MEMVACQCDDLPPHDHFMGHAQDERGVWGPVWDPEDIGRVWVRWKEVARAFAADAAERTQQVTEVQFRSDMTVERIDSMGSDDSIVQAMLVSTKGADAKDEEATYGRINFLMANRHGTPFEHAAMTFYAEVPIFVFREWHRHRIGVSYNEMSGRYTQLPPMYYVPGPNRNLVQVGKPGHYEFVPGDPETYEWLVADMKEEAITNYARYEERIERGVAKEVARMSLGINIYSAQFFTCNPRSLMAYLSLRTKREDSTFPSYPQREIEMASEMMEEHFARLFPLTYRSFNENGRVCP